MAVFTLATLDNSVQLALRNLTNSPFTQSSRVDAYNRVIDFLQSKANWKSTQKVAYFDYLTGENEYSLANDVGISDFKQFRDLRFVNDSENNHVRKIEEIGSEDFSVFEGLKYKNNVVNFEDRSGGIVMRFLSNKGYGKSSVDEMTDLTTGRTWASNTSGSDATTLAADTNRVKTGGACLKFNINVSQSGNNYSEIYTSTVFSSPIDATNEENLGYFRFWLGLHSVTSANLARISSVTFVWGSDASATPSTKTNYWSRTVTTPVLGGAFRNTWNRMSFDWASATQTGSPNAATIRYFEIRITYTSAMIDSNNVRIDGLDLIKPSEMELLYFSTNFVSKAGVWQDHFTTSIIDTTETLLIPYTHFNLFVNEALKVLWPQKQKNSEDYIRVSQESERQLALAILQDGYAITREKGEFQVNGNSSGRDDGNILSQW